MEYLQQIEEAFSPLREDSKRTFEINGAEVVISYNGFYKWATPETGSESRDFEQFHECLQDALEYAPQEIEDYHWLQIQKGEEV